MMLEKLLVLLLKPTLSPDYFLQLGSSKWQSEMSVGLRSAYICTALAAKIMMNNSKSGLIVNVASSGGMR